MYYFMMTLILVAILFVAVCFRQTGLTARCRSASCTCVR